MSRLASPPRILYLLTAVDHLHWGYVHLETSIGTSTKVEEQKDQTSRLTISHVGDGNVHSLALFNTEAELEVVRHAVHEMVYRAIRLDGTCSGEHGVGLGKVEYLEEELGVGTVGLMESIKRTSKSHKGADRPSRDISLRGSVETWSSRSGLQSRQAGGKLISCGGGVLIQSVVRAALPGTKLPQPLFPGPGLNWPECRRR